MSRKISSLSGLILLLMMAASLAACGVGEAKNTAEPIEDSATALPVAVAYPERADLFANYLATGAIEADAEAPVLSKVDGEVVEILVEEGDTVVAGQVLARLDGERLHLEMKQAKALLDKVSKEYKRNLKLKEKDLVSAATVEGMRFDLARLNASLELKELDYSYTYIRAPISGVVSSRDIKLGQQLDVNTDTFRITDTSRLVVYLKIPQSELVKFAPGHVAEVRVDSMPDEIYSATIARISPTVDVTNGTFRATAYIENDSGWLAPGMFGRFRIAYEKHSDALAIPAAAVVNEDDESVVYVVEDGAAVRRAVVTGIETDGLIEIVDGLSADEQIVVTGQSSLRDGSKVLASIPAKQPVTG